MTCKPSRENDEDYAMKQIHFSGTIITNVLTELRGSITWRNSNWHGVYFHINTLTQAQQEQVNTIYKTGDRLLPQTLTHSRTHTPTHGKLIGLFQWHFLATQSVPRWFDFHYQFYHAMLSYAGPSCTRDGLSPEWGGGAKACPLRLQTGCGDVLRLRPNPWKSPSPPQLSLCCDSDSCLCRRLQRKALLKVSVCSALSAFHWISDAWSLVSLLSPCLYFQRSTLFHSFIMFAFSRVRGLVSLLRVNTKRFLVLQFHNKSFYITK